VMGRTVVNTVRPTSKRVPDFTDSALHLVAVRGFRCAEIP